MAVGLTNSSGQPAPYQVGDTLTTARTGLGDNWLLCNGANVNVEDYPGLSIMAPQIAGTWNEISLTNVPKNGRLKYVNGYYFLIINSTDSASIYYTQSLESGTWTSLVSTSYDEIDITYGNGYWVRTNPNRIEWATSLSGSWTKVSLSASSINCVEFGDGKFLALSSRYVLTCTDPTVDDNWVTSSKFWSVYQPNLLLYAEGYWLAMTQDPNTLYVTSSLSGSWQAVVIAYNGNYQNIRFLNGLFFVTGTEGICYAENPSTASNWTKIGGLTDGDEHLDIAFGGGWYCVTSFAASGGKLYYSYSNSLDIQFSTNSTYGSVFPTSTSGIMFSNNMFVTPAPVSDITYTASINVASLPTISLDKTYTYIKAK